LGFDVHMSFDVHFTESSVHGIHDGTGKGLFNPAVQ